jgi:uncharacterized protein
MAKRTSRSKPARASRGLAFFLVAMALAAVGLAVWLIQGNPFARSADVAPAEPPEVAETAPPPRKPAARKPAARPAPVEPAPEEAREQEVEPAEPVYEEPHALEVEEPAPRTPVPPRTGAPGRVSVVIDDLGRRLEDLDRLGALGVPVSYAVLPFESRTGPIVARLRAEKREILVHLPMAAEGRANPGPGALTEDMSAEELVAGTRRALEAVPGAVGVNNHMGSRLSADAGAMHTILSVLAGRSLYFLDSRTSAESVGFATAQKLGLPAAERQVFLDPDRRLEAVRAQFLRLLEAARERGAAIGIGHPYEETFQVLAEEIPKARQAGFEFVPVSYLVDAPGGLPE